MKKMTIIALLLCLCLVLLVACGNGDEDVATPEDPVVEDTTPEAPDDEVEALPVPDAVEPDDEGIREIRLAAHNAVVDGNTYRIRYEADIVEAVEDAVRFGFQIDHSTFVSNWDASTEAEQIRASIDSGVDIILVNPVASTGLDPLIEMAQAAGILWVNADVIYTSPYVDILNIATDQEYLGYRTAMEAGRVLGQGARVLMVEAMPGNVANEDRQRGFERGIEYWDFDVVGTGYHNWNADMALQTMTEILNMGVEFDGVLISQVADSALTAFENTGAPLPRFMGFHDSGDWMQRMITLNEDEHVMDFLVLSNPPGVGATALNFGLNILLGREMRTDIFDDDSIRSILIPPRIWFNYDNMEDYREMAFAMAPGDAISFWLDVDEVNEQFFR